MSRTVGVEEEFLLLRSSAALAPAGDAVVETANADAEGQFEHELKREQAEIGTTPQHSLVELERQLRQLRADLAASAAEHGARLAALATSPLPGPATTTPDPRYYRMTEQFGRIGSTQLSCGMHVHVSIDSPEEGVAVLNRIRPALPILLALSANSPFLQGADTGYQSYRRILWGQWPTAGVTDEFADFADYERARAQLVATGAAMDDGMIYFDARLSARYPTLEIRVADVCPYAQDASTIAALARALVSTLAAEAKQGRGNPRLRSELLRAASWRAARYGLTGELVDLTRASTAPAWDLIGRLVERVTPALTASEDLELVTQGLTQIQARGNGATLQRNAFAAAGKLSDVIDAVVARTAL
ncbi:MAG: putative glutamate--cysteine ligase 2 [Frankiales bacterium]|nr:putative glutamate--cysteine ligase 2 [Frankiales bacterium]